MNEQLLTPGEEAVIKLLQEAWNAYCGQLSTLHPEAQAEFRQAIHRAQDIDMARPVQRMFNRRNKSRD